MSGAPEPCSGVEAAWFLSPAERGNPDTAIDLRRRDGAAWTRGNRVTVLVDGRQYFSRLHDVLFTTSPGDWVCFTDLEGVADEQLAGPGTEVSRVLADLAATGVNVRGLLWRSHPSIAKYAEGRNLAFARTVNDAGGRVLLDQRVRRGGSHHQKLVVIRRPSDPSADVAFVGGIDLAHGRHDDARHLGDPQPADLDDGRYGERPPWHDAQVEVRGPAVEDLAWTFRERWDDPTPLDSRTPLRALTHRYAKHPSEPGPLAPEQRPPEAGPHAVQVLRTYPARRPAYPYARQGERSIARAYIKAFGHARSHIYLEDQYLWSFDAMRTLAAALRREPSLHLVVVVPRYPDPDGRLAGTASRYGRQRVVGALHDAGGERVAVYDLENEEGTPIYVHSKVCVVDDVWLAVGSDNVNRRSWTHDSELSCAVIDDRRDDREPRDPGGRGDGARVLARDARLRLAREHLGWVDDVDLVDPGAWFRALDRSAAALDAWHASGRRGPRPPGHLRRHPPDDVGPLGRVVTRWMHATVLDPDGRPRALRRDDRF